MFHKTSKIQESILLLKQSKYIEPATSNRQTSVHTMTY